jgi:hypothetical protein
MLVDDGQQTTEQPGREGNMWEVQLREAQDLATRQAAELAIERAKNVEMLAKVNEGLAAAANAEAALALARAEGRRVEALLWAKRTETLQAAADLAYEEAGRAEALAAFAEAQSAHAEMLVRLEAAHQETLGVIEKLRAIIAG